MPRTRPLQLAAKRVRQTLGFRNGPRVLLDLASAGTPWRRPELRFDVGGGVTITCPNRPGARVPVYEVFAEDGYRLDALTARLDDDPVVLDIGAQIGCFTVAVATRRPDATVHAYEASPTTAVWLTRNINRNGLADRVTAHDRAVSDHTGTLDFVDSGDASALSGLTARDGATMQVPCVSFADAVAAAGGRVDLVKIDTEGAEYEIVLGSDPAVWESVQEVVLEYHPVEGRDWSQLEQFFAAAGLSTVALEPVWEGLGTAWLSRRH